MKATGRTISRNIGMPLALIGAAAVKSAMDFQSSMVKIQTLVGESSKSVKELEEVVLGLSKETAQSPKELAEAMFFLKSAQLSNADAAAALEMSAKASAIGLGETKDIALVSAAVMNSYGSEVYTAAEATDILAATVRKGMLNAEDLAPEMGDLLGLAQSLGISFEELGANIATYTLTGVNASTATTGLKGVMAAIAKGTPSANAELKKYNLSWDKIRESVKEKGLLETLAMLKQEVGNNAAAFSKIFGRVQGLSNVLNVSGKQLNQYRENLDEITNSAGLTATGFELVQQTADFKMKKALNGIRLAGVRLGAMLLPIVEKIAIAVENMLKFWEDLPTETKKWVAAIGGILILAGPLLTFIGFLGTMLGFIMSPIGLVIAGLVGLGVAISKNKETVKKWAVDIINYFIDLYNESMVFRGMIQSLIFAVKTMWENWKFFYGLIADLTTTFVNHVGTLFGGIGKIIKGVFTFSWDDVKEGMTDIVNGMKNSWSDMSEKIIKRSETWGENTMLNFKKGLDKTKSREKLEFVTEEDIDNTMGNIKDWFGDKWQSVKEFMLNNIAEGFVFPDFTPEPGGGGGGGNGGGNGGGGDDGYIEDNQKQKSALRTLLENKSEMWKKYFQRQDKQWESWGEKTQAVIAQVADVAAQITSSMSELSSLQHNKRMIEIGNKEQRELDALNTMALTEEQLEKRKNDIKNKFDKKRAAANKKKAKADKAFQMMGAVINTARAVAEALPNIPLSILIGGLGAAQIATIASTPIPAMAEGGLAFGPTLGMVGDNPNAGVDPEVIAPLSKLKQMMGGDKNQNIHLAVSGELKGDNMWLQQEATDINRNRYI